MTTDPPRLTFKGMARFLVLLALVSGCSVTLQARPQRAGGVVSAGCTTGSGYWIADAAISGVALATGAAGFVVAETDGNKTAGQVMAGVGILSGLIYYASMDNGRKWARECAADVPSLAHL